MRVCMASTSFDPILPQRQGAINTYVFELAKKLSQWDTVSLFGRGKGHFDEGNLHVQSFSYSLPPAFSKYTRIRESTYSSLYSKHLIASIQKLNKNQPVQILHINSLYETPVAKFLKNLLHVQTVCSVHNTFITPLLMGSCDKILANSYYMKKFLIDEMHLEKKKIDVLPIAVDINAFKPVVNAKKELGLHGRDVILFIGRKVPYKGPQVLIDALPEICKAYPETLAILIGPDDFFGSHSGSYSDFLKERARKLNVEKNIIIKSFVPETALRMYLNAADVFVCPSIWQEPFGKVVIEASACEKPVVATKVGGLPELVKDGENGILIPPNHPSALANAVLNLLGDKKAAKRMGKRGRQIVESNFSYEVASAKCQAIYKGMLIGA